MSRENANDALEKEINDIFQSASDFKLQEAKSLQTITNTLQPSSSNTSTGDPFFRIIHSKNEESVFNLRNQSEEQLQLIKERKHIINELEDVIEKTKKELATEQQNLAKIKNKIAKYDEKFLDLAKREQVLATYKTLTGVSFSNSNSSAFKGYIERKETSEIKVIFNEEVDETLEHERLVKNMWDKIEEMYK